MTRSIGEDDASGGQVMVAFRLWESLSVGPAGACGDEWGLLIARVRLISSIQLPPGLLTCAKHVNII